MSILGLNFDWKLMSKVQDILALIDGSKSCWAHNLAGRIVGSIPKPYNPLPTISDAVKMLKNIKAIAGGGGDEIFFEYGTGWVPSLPIGLWLGGARKTITIDANTYMQNRYVKEAAWIIAQRENEIKEMYGDLLNEKRLETLIHYVTGGGGGKCQKIA
ncbi:MAG: hypothetical protein LBK66_10220 [Spirochaetaceae bacterium]|jgi:hypothetical protein|nr:hypothetical protein [Spirochaetaceae bacterium]